MKADIVEILCGKAIFDQLVHMKLALFCGQIRHRRSGKSASLRSSGLPSSCLYDRQSIRKQISLASESKPRSSMTTVIAVGIGVAAAAFFVSTLSVERFRLQYTKGAS